LGTECVDIGMLLTSIKSGGYTSQVAGNGCGGSVDIGGLYADQERWFLITLCFSLVAVQYTHPWPRSHLEQDVQWFSTAITFAMGARALDSIGHTCKLTIAVEIVRTVWELKLESRQLKCGASADHIPILSGLCTGYNLCNMSSSSIWEPGGPLFLLHHLTVTRVKMLIVSYRILILLGSMCKMMIQSMQLHDVVFCRILCLDSYGSGMYYNCRDYAGFKVICQLPALVIAPYFV
jgi:hypothetical protein